MIGVLVDLDGVLWFSEEAHKKAFIMAFSFFTHSAESFVNDTWQFGESTEEYAVRLLNLIKRGDEPKAISELVNTKREISSKLVNYQTNNSLLEALQVIKKDKVLIALVSSSSPENVDKFFRLSRSKSLFDFIIDRSMVNNPKPSPECYIKTMVALGVSPEKCMAIEDSEVGIMAAQKAQVKILLSYPASFQLISEIELLKFSIKELDKT